MHLSISSYTGGLSGLPEDLRRDLIARMTLDSEVIVRSDADFRGLIVATFSVPEGTKITIIDGGFFETVRSWASSAATNFARRGFVHLVLEHTDGEIRVRSPRPDEQSNFNPFIRARD